MTWTPDQKPRARHDHRETIGNSLFAPDYLTILYHQSSRKLQKVTDDIVVHTSEVNPNKCLLSNVLSVFVVNPSRHQKYLTLTNELQNGHVPTNIPRGSDNRMFEHFSVRQFWQFCHFCQR